MKKLLALVLAMIMLISFAGCGAKCSVEGCENEPVESSTYEEDFCMEHLVEKCVESADSYISNNRYEKEYNYVFSGYYLEEENAYTVVMQLNREAVEGLVALSEGDASRKALLRMALVATLDNDEELISILLPAVVGDVEIFFEGTDVEIMGGYIDYDGNVTYTYESEENPEE